MLDPHAKVFTRGVAMFDSSLGRRLFALIATAAFAVGASATAVFSSRATSTFTIVGPVTDIKENLPSSPTSGNGMVDFAIVSGEDVHPVTVDSKVSGSATAPLLLSSSAAALRGHLVEVDRTPDLISVVLEFEFVMAWHVSLSVDMPFFETARGGAYFALSGFEADMESLVVDDALPGEMVVDAMTGHTRWEFNPDYFTSFAPVDTGILTRTITGRITVFEDRVGAFSVITDAAGEATARPMSAPGGLFLLAAPLLLIALRRR